MSNLTKDKGKAPMYENITGDDDPPSAGFHCGSSSILSEQFVHMNLIDASNHFCGEDQQAILLFLSGFSIRIGPMKKWNDTITHRYLLCAKAGKPKDQNFDTQGMCKLESVRARTFKVSDCKARLKLKAVTGCSSFVVYDFLESHNHELVSAENADLTQVQKEIVKGLFSSFITNYEDVNGVDVFTVHHADKNSVIINAFKVEVDMSKNLFSCSCALPKTVYGLANMYTSDNSDMSAKRNDVLDLVTQCMDRLRGHPDRLVSFAQQIREMKVEVFENYPVEGCSNSKSAMIRELVGDVNHSDVPFTARRGIKNKGSGTKRRRFIGPGERASVTRKKPGRKCRKCLGIGDHDSRNCPLNEDVEST
ncbi:hypothetical protein L1987_78147 [Smallanthus sonchifolius]|uniref:Uncharacterized protein n=1 Tax=Smallanthus sonchifolius TaxID=185202 RepID=A0ACB8ZC24_9ASTR|nr:hypothetical protein L1987_78147 [Smallanthus sonchifolius]